MNFHSNENREKIIENNKNIFKLIDNLKCLLCNSRLHLPFPSLDIKETKMLGAMGGAGVDCLVCLNYRITFRYILFSALPDWEEYVAYISTESISFKDMDKIYNICKRYSYMPNVVYETEVSIPNKKSLILKSDSFDFYNFNKDFFLKRIRTICTFQ